MNEDQFPPADAEKATVIREDPLCRELDSKGGPRGDDGGGSSNRKDPVPISELIRKRFVAERQQFRMDVDGWKRKVEIRTPTLKVEIPLSDGRDCSLEHGQAQAWRAFGGDDGEKGWLDIGRGTSLGKAVERALRQKGAYKRIQGEQAAEKQRQKKRDLARGRLPQDRRRGPR